MYTADELITIALPLLKKYPVRKAALFGSYARSEQCENSDVDILLEFAEPVGLGYGSLYLDLKEALPVAVGLLTVAGLEEQPARFKESVSRDMVVFYEK